MVALRKKLKLGNAYLHSLAHPLPLWVHLWVTERCNLSCDYCYVVDNRSADPAMELVQSWVAHAESLGTAIVAFMGGEPTLRKDLAEIVSAADEKNLITYLTTNGKLLISSRLEELARAGLDFLEVSVDGYQGKVKSPKTLPGNDSYTDLLESARREYGLRFKLHQVLTPETAEETANLLELAKNRRILISFGMVYSNNGNTSFNPEEKEKVGQALKLILEKKKEGFPILNPLRYFVDALFSLEHPLSIDCDVGRYMLQISVRGKVYACSKLGEESEVDFLGVDRGYFVNDKHGSKELLKRCSSQCLSACAYGTHYYREHPLELIRVTRT